MADAEDARWEQQQAATGSADPPRKLAPRLQPSRSNLSTSSFQGALASMREALNGALNNPLLPTGTARSPSKSARSPLRTSSLSVPKKSRTRTRDIMAISFPQVAPQDAVAFVQEWSELLECGRRWGGRCWGCCRRRRRDVKVFCRVDLNAQALERRYEQDGPVKKTFLADVQNVHPLIVDDSPSSTERMLDFVVVTMGSRYNFRAASRENAKYWVTALQHLANHRLKNATPASRLLDFARTHFQKADTDGDGTLVLAEVQRFFNNLNVTQGPKYLRETFQRFDKDGSGTITVDEFAELFRMMMVKRPLIPFFEKYSVLDAQGERVMPWRNLCDFITEVQGKRMLSEEQVAQELTEFGEPLVTKGRDALTEVGFCAFICSRRNSILDPAVSAQSQDMSRPLSQYWISSSHNTYLEDFQIAGTASVEQYIHVIRQGCRCVEIDCWDGANGEPAVTHGYAMCNRISFSEVAQAIRDHAFQHSRFPLILSLEMRCKTQVAKVGQILNATFGDMLLRHPPHGHQGEPLISPLSACGKVIVKAKLATGRASHTSSPDADSDDDGAEAHAESAMSHKSTTGRASDSSLAGAQTQTDQSLSLRSAGAMVISSTAAAMANSAAGAALAASGMVVRKRDTFPKGLGEYNHCIYLVARRLSGLEQEREKCNVASFSDTDSRKFIKKHGPLLQSHHCAQLTRVYPPSGNVTSANFCPMPHWIHGVQLVALNFQCTDRSMILNEGMFREQNGGCGYVLKPPSVLSAEAREAAQASGGPWVKLQIRLLSAHFLPKPRSDQAEREVELENINPSVIVSIHGVEADSAHFETECVKNDGFAPEWGQDCSFKVTWEDVAIIAFEVYHHVTPPPLGRRPTLGAMGDTRKLVAAAAFPVRGIRPGLRWVPLWDSCRASIENCGILVEVKMSRVSGTDEVVVRERTATNSSTQMTMASTFAWRTDNPDESRADTKDGLESRHQTKDRGSDQDAQEGADDIWVEQGSPKGDASPNAQTQMASVRNDPEWRLYPDPFDPSGSPMVEQLEEPIQPPRARVLMEDFEDAVQKLAACCQCGHSAAARRQKRSREEGADASLV